MTNAGWYPDPAGAPDTFRYWDGQSWSQMTTAQPPTSGAGQVAPQGPPAPPTPAGPPPGAGAPAGPGGGQPGSSSPGDGGVSTSAAGAPWAGSGSGYGDLGAPGAGALGAPGGPGAPAGPGQGGWSPQPGGGGGGGRGKTVMIVVAAVLALLLLGTGGFFGVRALQGDDGDKKADDPSSKSTTTDDTDSTDGTESTESTDSTDGTDGTDSGPSAGTTSTYRPTGIQCTGGDPIPEKELKKKVKNLSAGGVTIPRPKGFEANGYAASPFTYADHLAIAGQLVEKGWVSLYAVGSIPTADGFDSTEQAAEIAMQCMVANEDVYSGFKSRTDLSHEEVTVDGKKGYRVSSEIRVAGSNVSVEGDVTTVVVIDTGDADNYGFYMSVVPIGDADRIAQADKIYDQISVK